MALYNNLFADFSHSFMTPNNFELKVNHDTPGKVVSTFFVTNEKYYKDEALDSINCNDACFEIEAYVALVKHIPRGSFDNRSSSVEIQLDEPIALERPQLRAVVMPSPLLDRLFFRDRMIKWGATPLIYPWINRVRPLEYTSEIFSIVRNFLAAEGFFG